MCAPDRRFSVVAFDFENLFRSSDEAVLQRFRVTGRVIPGVVPKDFKADACRITRDLEAITLLFLRREGPDDPGTEVLTFSFKPAA